MRKYRFFCNQIISEVGQELELDSALAHHISRVLRLAPGEIIYVFNNTLNEFKAEIMHISKNSVKVVVAAIIELTTESPLDLHLALAIIKFDKIDLILQKACELGVKKISLINMQHSSIKGAYQRALEKTEHWQKILESAAAQCWRSQVPNINIFENLSNFLIYDKATALKLILDPRAAQTYKFNEECQYPSISALIGPEGGFSVEEIKLLSPDYAQLMLGPRILRTETACFCALTLLQAKYGDLLC